MTIRLLYLVSHPIQYQAPLLRLIAREPDIALRVVFEQDFSSGRYRDEGFGVDVQWDIPLRDGYDSVLAAEIEAPGPRNSCINPGTTGIMIPKPVTSINSVTKMKPSAALGLAILLIREEQI